MPHTDSYYKRNKKKVREYARKYYQEHKEEIRLKRQTEKYREYKRTHARKYQYKRYHDTQDSYRKTVIKRQIEWYNSKYHNDPAFREKRKEYIRNRYHNDPVFREKRKEASKKYLKKRFEEDPDYHLIYNERRKKTSLEYYYRHKDEINKKRRARYKPKPKNPNRLVHKKISNELIWESIKKYNTRREFRFQDYKMYRLALERHLIRDYVFPDEELKKNIIYKSHTKEYKREYRRMRYHTEPEYRKKAYEYVLNWQHRNKEKIREYKRKYYLKKHGKKS